MTSVNPAQGLREFCKSVALILATIVVMPEYFSYLLRRAIMGRDRAFANSVQLLSLVPGLVGQYLRRAFLRLTLAHCHATATVEFGTTMSRTGASLHRNAYVGAQCHLGCVDVGTNVLIAPGVLIPSGPNTHGSDDVGLPIRDQPGKLTCVHLGQGCWIGGNAVILADVGENAIVAAGSVVTKPVADYAVVAGVPARLVRSRLKSNK